MRSSPPATAKLFLLVATANSLGWLDGWCRFWFRLVSVELAQTDLAWRVTIVNPAWCIDGWLRLGVPMVIRVSVVKKAVSLWFRRDTGCGFGSDCEVVKTQLIRVESRIWLQLGGISKNRLVLGCKSSGGTV
ncbi:unnamed protein product [Arabidopsis halleri]